MINKYRSELQHALKFRDTQVFEMFVIKWSGLGFIDKSVASVILHSDSHLKRAIMERLATNGKVKS